MILDLPTPDGFKVKQGKKKMKIFKAALAMALISVMAGCAAYHDQGPVQDRRVTVSPNMGMSAWVREVSLNRVASQQFTLQAKVQNNTGSVLPMEYRVVWVDAAGKAIPSVVSTWLPVSAAPYEMVNVQATGPAPDAVDFRFYVRAKRQK